MTTTLAIRRANWIISYEAEIRQRSRVTVRISHLSVISQHRTQKGNKKGAIEELAFALSLAMLSVATENAELRSVRLAKNALFEKTSLRLAIKTARIAMIVSDTGAGPPGLGYKRFYVRHNDRVWLDVLFS